MKTNKKIIWDITKVVSSIVVVLGVLAMLGFIIYNSINAEIADPAVQAVEWTEIVTLVLVLVIYVATFFKAFVKSCKDLNRIRKDKKLLKRNPNYKPFK